MYRLKWDRVLFTIQHLFLFISIQVYLSMANHPKQGRFPGLFCGSCWWQELSGARCDETQINIFLHSISTAVLCANCNAKDLPVQTVARKTTMKPRGRGLLLIQQDSSRAESPPRLLKCTATLLSTTLTELSNAFVWLRVGRLFRCCIPHCPWKQKRGLSLHIGFVIQISVNPMQLSHKEAVIPFP